MKHKKYYHATLAAVAVASSAVILTPSAEASFQDIHSTDYFYEAVQSLSERGIIKGFTDGTFKPYENVTRGQAAKMIAGVLGLDTVNVTNPNFSDVSETNEYYGAIAALANAGYINGYTDGTYRPDAPIQRNHMAKIIAKAFNLQASSTAVTPFTDLNQEYQEYIQALFENGITTGNTATTFGGTLNVTRGQLATFIVRAENINVANEVTLTISEVTGATVNAGEKQYKVAKNLQGFFGESNSEALKNAVIKVEVQKDEIVAVSSLVINTAGKEGKPVIFDGNNAKLNSVVVNADYVELKNTVVQGDVTLSNRVVNEFSSDQLTINGQLIVNDTNTVAVASLSSVVADVAKGPKINLKNSNIQKVQSNRNGAVISSNVKISEIVVTAKVSSIQIDADVTKVTVDVDVKIAITGNGNLDEVAVQKAKELTLNVIGKVATLAVDNTDAKVEIGVNAKVDTVVIPKNSKVSEVVSNYNAVKENISKVEESKTSSDVTTNNNSNTSKSGSGGSSSSSSSSSDKDKTAPTVSVVNGSYFSIGKSVVAKSTEVGTLYLVEENQTFTNLSALESLVNKGYVNKVSVTEANIDTEIPTENLKPGYYKVYAVDKSGNLSQPVVAIEMDYFKSNPTFKDKGSSINIHVETVGDVSFYYVVLPSNAQMPTAEQVSNSGIYPELNVIYSNKTELTANTPKEIIIDGLDENESYQIYFVANYNNSKETSTYSMVKGITLNRGNEADAYQQFNAKYGTLLQKGVNNITLQDEAEIEAALKEYYSLSISEQEVAKKDQKVLLAYVEKIAELKISEAGGDFTFSSFKASVDDTIWDYLSFAFEEEPSIVSLSYTFNKKEREKSSNGLTSPINLTTTSVPYAFGSGEGDLIIKHYYLKLEDEIFAFDVKYVGEILTLDSINKISTFEDITNDIEYALNKAGLYVNVMNNGAKEDAVNLFLSRYFNVIPPVNFQVTLENLNGEMVYVISLTANGITKTINVDNNLFIENGRPFILGENFEQATSDTITFTFSESLYMKDENNDLVLADLSNSSDSLFVLKALSDSAISNYNHVSYFFNDDRTELTIDFSASTSKPDSEEKYTILFDQNKIHFYDQYGNELEPLHYITQN